MDWTYALRQMLLPEEGGRAKTFSRPGTLVSATSQFANDDPVLLAQVHHAPRHARQFGRIGGPVPRPDAQGGRQRT